jgi:hypothetical protein
MNPQEAVKLPAGHNIAMWGTPGSGKTTFLAALSIALGRHDLGWKLVGSDHPSTNALIQLTTELMSRQRFPEATVGIERYSWFLVGPPGRRARAWFGRNGGSEDSVKIGLDLRDPSGEIFGLDRASDELVEHLVNSRGIIYLFDPVWEFAYGDSFDYLYGVLSRLAQRMLGSPDFADGRLPHHMAVCITKFDDIRMLETAEKLRLVTYDSSDQFGFPRVSDGEAPELFRKLCEVSRSGNAELVFNYLQQYFHPERVRFYVTSSIGFHMNPALGRFDPDDFQNLIPDPADPKRLTIRGPVYPINVMEPVLWLGRQLSAQRERGRR